MDDAAIWIALGSLFVAVVGTGLNALAIRREATHRKEQISTEWAKEWAAQRPVIYPVASPEWAYAMSDGPYRSGNHGLLPLKNGGRGPALDVRGAVDARTANGSPYEREILAGTIAAGDLLDARVVPHPGVQQWHLAVGWIRYSDLVGNAYETRFRFSHGPGNELVLEIDPPNMLSADSLDSEPEGGA